MENNSDDNTRKEPSHKMDGKYAILMETSGEEFESWYYFIRIDGNEENLKYLHDQMEKVNFYVLDDLSTFDLEIEHPVSAQTAKEMSKVDLNAMSFHRKFDGTLKKIDFDFKNKDGNETKICKVFDVLGEGQIEDYISDEDIDEEDLVSVSTGSESVSSDESVSDDESESNDESGSDSDSNSVDDKIPKSILRDRLKNVIKEKKDERINKKKTE
jgi:hypothetical protein